MGVRRFSVEGRLARKWSSRWSWHRRGLVVGIGCARHANWKDGIASDGGSGRAYCLGGYSRQATSTTTLVASRAKGAWSALLYMQGDQVVGAFCARRARPDSSGRPGQQYTPQCWRGNFVFLGRSSFSCGRKLSRRRMGTRRFCVEGRLAMTS